MKVIALSLAFIILFVIGIFQLFHVSFSEYFSRWAELLRRKKKSVRQRRKELISGQRKAPRIIRAFDEARDILTQTGRPKMFSVVVVLSIVLGVAGVFIGVLTDNIFLIPVFGIGLAAAPVAFVHSKEPQLAARVNGSMKETLSVITNTYIQTEDIVHAFRSNLSLLKPPFDEACAEFVAEATFLQANIPRALQNLRHKIDNEQFREWCDALMQCYDNKELKQVLPVIVEKVDENISVQNELDTLTIPETAHFRTVVIICVVMIPLMLLIEPSWFFDMAGNPIGKFIIALAAAVVIAASIAAVRILKPVKY